MEIADVRKRVLITIDRARRKAADRRERVAEAEREYGEFLERVAVPLFHQLGVVLRAEGFAFTVFTPGGSVRLMSDRSRDDYIELVLDTTGDEPQVVGRTNRGRGSRVIREERSIADDGPVRELGEEAVLNFLLRELGPFVER